MLQFMDPERAKLVDRPRPCIQKNNIYISGLAHKIEIRLPVRFEGLDYTLLNNDK
jgi:hypothetical protein